MRTLRVLIALALLAPVAVAGEEDARLARVAETYRMKEWPAAGPRRAGAPLLGVELDGWSRRVVRVDPRLAEGRVAFTGPGQAEVTLTLRVHAEASAARAALLARLAAAQGTLSREAVGEVAFGVREPKGRLQLLVGVRGNVGFELRATEAGAERTDAVEALALATDRALLEVPTVEARAPLPGPRVLAVRVAPARAGAPAAVTLDVDPAGPAVEHVAFVCDDPGASVIQTKDGWELLATRPGELQLAVFAVSKDLLAGGGRVTISVSGE